MTLIFIWCMASIIDVIILFISEMWSMRACSANIPA